MVAGVVMLLLLFGAAVFADVIAAHPPDRSIGSPFERPSGEHWLGTDDLGRDLWAQLVHGARVSLAVGMAAAIVATVVGTTVALIAGWRGGWIDSLLMRFVDLTLSVPFLVLILVLATYFGRGLIVLIVLIAGVLWARPARLLRAQVLKLRTFGHVVAANTMGAPTRRVLGMHVLRRLVPLLLSQFVRAAAVAVTVQSGVAFLGLGDPNRVSWGSTLFFANNGSAILTDAWLWWIVPPGVALTLLIVGLAFVGYGLEELAEPITAAHGWRPGVRRTLSNNPSDPPDDDITLDIRHLTIGYGDTTVVSNVSLSLRRGAMLGLVGESGSGKSTLVLGLLGLLPTGGTVSDGAVFLGDTDLRRVGRVGLSKIRGRDIAIVPQAAMSLLNPTMTILHQVQESVELGTIGTKSADRAASLLVKVGIEQQRHRAYPHELSGGQRQRVVIAMAIANQPQVLIADEPTTGLDVITQHEILDLLDELRADMDMQMLVISHDLALIASRADDLAIMYAGKVIESGPTAVIVSNPTHPYTELLLKAIPRLDGPRATLVPIPGDAPEPGNLPAGCSFAPRCPAVQPRCLETVPALEPVAGRLVACHEHDRRPSMSEMS